MDFPLFVYGTLKRGSAAHDRWCSGAERSAASCRGRLFVHDEGYPVLVLDPRDILAVGTSDASHDAALARRMQEPGPRSSVAAQAAPVLRREDAAPGDVGGELLRFGLTALPLGEIDDYEGFVPGKASLFVRVLTRVVPRAAGAPVCAWTYVGGTRLERAPLRPGDGSLWPPTGG
jgi:gamma-glutamylcyclotransferase (GGCT)/AIG2-like uncharacterized protein YtfP